ncbi:MAG: sulfur carrier protein ThiS [Chitinivibrionales bacterium]|nr:sulfur carrier protein ThiS [Chitinivibrionales bacterium]
MELTINGEKKQFEAQSLSISQLLAASKVEMPDTVSVQLNGSFVEREAFDATAVSSGDEVDFLYFMGGGDGK